MSIEFAARADPRALGGAALTAAGMSFALAAAYIAGGAARTASLERPLVRMAVAAPAERVVQPQAESTVSATQASLRGSAPEPAAPQILRAARGAGALECLTEAVYYEARGEGDRGEAAVAQVVLNRVRRAGFPKSVCGVVFQGASAHACQFSFACDGAMHQGREPAAWRRARGVAQRALDGFVMEEVGDSTNFHVASLGRIWGSGLVKVAQVGAHVFYRLTGHHGAVSTPSEPRFGNDDAIRDKADEAPDLILANAGRSAPAEDVPSGAAAPDGAEP